MSSVPKKIFITAGEISGDHNAALLVRAVREIDSSFEFVGIGSARMREAGVRLLADSTTWGSVGFFEGLAKSFKLYPAVRGISRWFEDEKPDLFVPVDYRVFNVRAAKIAKAKGLKVVYFFSPVSWFGSGLKRFRALAEFVDLSLVALPVSLDNYRAAGANFEFIGHPLVDAAHPSMTREQALEVFGLGDSRPVIGLMPGSRFQEIGRLMPVFVRAAEMIGKKMPDAQFLLLKASDAFTQMIDRQTVGTGIKVISGNIYDFMNVCDLLILCSGTAAHEATLMRKPMIINYKLSAVTAWIARRTIAPPMIGLPNIIAGEFIAPELVQEECTPEKVAGKALEILTSDEIRAGMAARLGEVAEKLGAPGVLARAARRVVDAANGIIPKLNG